MLNNEDIFLQSLVNHIYFAGSIRSFCSTIGLTFFKNNDEYIDRAIALGYRAADIINKTILLMNKEIATAVVENDVYITPYTKDLDLLTQSLFEISLVIQVDKDLQILGDRGDVIFDDEIMTKIDNLNQEAMTLINDFKAFCQEIKMKIDGGEVFSYLYPDFFNYMYDEISVYGRDIERILNKKDYTDFYLSEYTYYFNELLRESALYIRGFLDTSDQDIFDMASYYINAFANLTEKYLKNTDTNINLSIEAEKLVINYQKFVTGVIDKLLKAKIYFITPPITLDNFLTNINVYLFILKYARGISDVNV